MSFDFNRTPPNSKKATNYYNIAKHAEQYEKNFAKAEQYYVLAFQNKERLDSTVKDLATVMHQQGKTAQAIQFLEENRQFCKKAQQQKIGNLIESLKKQLIPAGNFLNKILAVFNVPAHQNAEGIKNLFGITNRIESVQFIDGKENVDAVLQGYEPIQGRWFAKPEDKTNRACLFHFSSNSGARRTIDSLKDDTIQFYWMSVKGKIVRKAEPYKKKDNHSDNSSDKGDGFDLDGESSTNKPCWNSCVFPSYEDNADSVFINNTNNGIWRDISTRQMEAKMKIDQDPNFMSNLLRKFASEEKLF
mmetsp:Transcript_16763/g.14662  ORF Transcript_16763/g.14662 Transcript_16763/m.14662 type:complete len:303 (+) Transcript_16763:2-910(+)